VIAAAAGALKSWILITGVNGGGRHGASRRPFKCSATHTAWERIGDALRGLRADPERSAEDKLREALAGLLAVGRQQPHLYRLMFTTPAGDPSALIRAAERSQDEFLAIVTELAGRADAYRFGALLMTAVHGIIGMEVSGHLTEEKWRTSPEELVDTLIGLLMQLRGTP
jgi:hypothetical protein